MLILQKTYLNTGIKHEHNNMRLDQSVSMRLTNSPIVFITFQQEECFKQFFSFCLLCRFETRLRSEPVSKSRRMQL